MCASAGKKVTIAWKSTGRATRTQFPLLQAVRLSLYVPVAFRGYLKVCECGNDGYAYCQLLPDHELMQKYLNWCTLETYKPSQEQVNDYYRAVFYVQVNTTEECVRKQLFRFIRPRFEQSFFLNQELSGLG